MEIKIGNKVYAFKDNTPIEVLKIFENNVKEIEYDFYIKYEKYFPNTKKNITGKCVKCGKKTTATINKLRRKSMTKNLLFCSLKCASLYTSSLNEWREKNSKAQLIAQNKEEQKRKNSEGVILSRKRWTEEQYNNWVKNSTIANKSEEKRKKSGETTKRKWKEDEVFRKKMLEIFKNGNYRPTSGIFKSINSGNIKFDSLLELFYIFFMDLKGFKIERFNDYIEYFNDEKKRFYLPDFLVDNNIIEIKSIVFLKEGKYDKRKEIAKKIDYAIDYVRKNGYNDYYLLTEKDLNNYFDFKVNDFKGIFSSLFDEKYVILNKERKWMYVKRRNKEGEEIYNKWKQLKLKEKK